MSRQTKEQKRAEYLKHKDAYITRAKKWVIENPDKRREVLARNNAKSADRKRQWAQMKNFGMLIDLVECKICGSDTGLVIHHRDGANGKLGKSLNNDPNNLVVLCRSCHAKTHYLGKIRTLV